MKQRQRKFNPKRRLLSHQEAEGLALRLARLADRVRYTGNPEHKRNPGDFGLNPPAGARPGKSICDDAAIDSRRTALRLLREGLRCALVSDRFVGEWPRNVWSVSDEGIPLESQHERDGCYHGYPMPVEDPFRRAVLERWQSAGPYSPTDRSEPEDD